VESTAACRSTCECGRARAAVPARAVDGRGPRETRSGSELQFQPGYSPKANPTELLNQDVKTNALGRRRPRCQDELIGDTHSYLRSTQRRPRLVARYFEGEHVRYAKAA